MDALFEMTPTAPARREIGAMPGDTVQPSLFGDAEVVVARKHPARTAAAVDATPVLFATDAGQFDGQTTTTDILGATEDTAEAGDDADGPAPTEDGGDFETVVFDHPEADAILAALTARHAPDAERATGRVELDFIGDDVVYYTLHGRYGMYALNVPLADLLAPLPATLAGDAWIFAPAAERIANARAWGRYDAARTPAEGGTTGERFVGYIAEGGAYRRARDAYLAAHPTR